jgi:hypothetical protein
VVSPRATQLSAFPFSRWSNEEGNTAQGWHMR